MLIQLINSHCDKLGCTTVTKTTLTKKWEIGNLLKFFQTITGSSKGILTFDCIGLTKVQWNSLIDFLIDVLTLKFRVSVEQIERKLINHCIG